MSNALHYLVAARRCEADELESLSRTCELVLTVSELVHCLQQERGISNIFLASAGERFAQRMQDNMAASDNALAAFRQWLDSTEAAIGLSGGARLYTRIGLALHALEGLDEMRRAIASFRYAATENSERYKNLIGVLLALVFEAADVAIDPGISRLLIALFHLMQGKEFAGRERATGAAAFAAGQITEELSLSVEYLIEMQEQAFSRFESFASDLRLEWAALQARLPLSELERLRRKLLTSHGQPLDRTLADSWYVCCSTRMDELHHVETHLAGVLQQHCREKIADLRKELDDQEQLFSRLGNSDPVSPLAAFSSRIEADSIASKSADAGVGPHLTQAVVEMLRSQSERLQSLTDELATIRASLDERKLIDRAKGLLMVHHGLDEESAYNLLRRNAMNQNRRIIDVAQAVLSLAEILPGANPKLK